MPFVDTNVLLYAISSVREERKKRATARTILDREDCVLSTQVLQEFYVQATRSSRPDPISHEQASALIEAWARFRIVDVTLEGPVTT